MTVLIIFIADFTESFSKGMSWRCSYDYWEGCWIYEKIYIKEIEQFPSLKDTLDGF
jgi:hypothetical protein